MSTYEVDLNFLGHGKGLPGKIWIFLQRYKARASTVVQGAATYNTLLPRCQPGFTAGTVAHSAEMIQ